ncbi:Acg family FMN-binding oxidoreductase [Actinokineospora bangkokensis]|uniref:NAD(P)H nitroreductase n=1 Tax=Actinokineospora bangkokensis TaxID=1193682 RepID=A0A1Q9LR43_9PSEU|nr:hypothetical protein [Actinokineospora bangkokensis]OLR94473.1 hypothetical protein BJP25_12030 [Actinokineospora bangkokensis]
MSTDGAVNTALADHGGPDAETLRAAVRMACWAPSVHNTQPWRWRLVPGGVRLSVDRGRWLRAADSDGRDLLISCGAALHHLRVSLAAFGWAAVVTRFPDPTDRDLLAEVSAIPAVPGQVEVTDAVSITRRRSDRRAYAPWPATDVVLAELVARAALQGVVAEVVGGTARTALRSAIAAADAAQSADDRYHAELARWCGRPDGAEDGIPAANIPAATEWEGLVLRGFPNPVLPPAPAGRSGGSLLVLGTASDDGESRLRAGEATSAVLLGATGLRLASCALSQPVEVPGVRELLRTRVLRGDLVPQLVVRVGWPSPGAGELPRTPRRNLTSVLG